MNRRFALACLFVLLSPNWGFAYEPAEREAIKSFAFKGIGFGASADDLQRKLTVSFFEDQSMPEKGQRVFCHIPDHGDISGVFFSFIDDSLYEIRLVYDAPTANRIGGWDTIAERLVTKFGKADGNSKGTDVEEPEIASLFWNYSDDNRFIEMQVDKKYTRVTFTDLAGMRRWEAAKKKGAEVGF